MGLHSGYRRTSRTIVREAAGNWWFARTGHHQSLDQTSPLLGFVCPPPPLKEDLLVPGCPFSWYQVG